MKGQERKAIHRSRGPAQHIKGTPCVSRFLSKTIAYARRLAIISPRFREIPLFLRSEISASDLGSQPQICDLGCQTLRSTDPGAGSTYQGYPLCFAIPLQNHSLRSTSSYHFSPIQRTTPFPHTRDLSLRSGICASDLRSGMPDPRIHRSRGRLYISMVPLVFRDFSPNP